MIDHAALSTAYDSALRAAYDEINELAELHGRWGLMPANALVHALGGVLSGWQDYDRQYYVRGSRDEAITDEDMYAFLAGEVGAALWKRPNPPTANGV